MQGFRVAVAALLAALFGFAAVDAANAQCTGKPVYEDTFQTLDPAWDVAANDTVTTVDKGSLVIKPRPGFYRWQVNQSDFFGDGSICVTARVAESSNIEKTTFGVLFWANDYSSMYALELGFEGGKSYFQIFRRSKDRWLYPMKWTESDAVKANVGESNAIEVRTRGRQVTVLVNGKQLAQLNGLPPEGGGLIGVFASSPEGTAPAAVAFQKFQFFNPPGFRP